MKPKLSIVVALAPWREAEILKYLEKQDYPKNKYEIIVVKGTNVPDNRNEGVKKSEGQIILFLDDDAIIEEDFLNKVDKFFEEHKVDILGGPQLTPESDGFFAKTSGYALANRFAVSSLSRRYRKAKFTLDADSSYLTGANLIVKKKVFDKIGFDRAVYPADDVNFVETAIKLGYKVAYDPEIFIYHRRRENFGGLVKQIFDYGRSRSEKNIVSHLIKNPLLVVPSLFLIYILFLPSLFILNAWFSAPLVFYVFLNLLFSLYESRNDLGSVFLLPLLFVVIHFSYGMGFIVGLFNKSPVNLGFDIKLPKKLPKVSFVVCTLNCKDYAERCFKSIRSQDYPQNKVEIVVVDSYSTDGTLEVAKKYGATVILTKIRGYMEGKGMPKSIGVSKARGDIIITIDSDNKLVERDWIKKTIYPLLTNKEVDFCISRQAIVKSDPLINQYLGLVGTDPFAIYCSVDPQISLGNLPLKDNGAYYTYELDPKDFYICGGYYLTFRKSTLKKIGGYSRDVDVVYTLAKKGLGTVAIPKNAHLHHLITKGNLDFVKKKMKWGRYYFNNPNLEREFKWSEGLFGKFGKIRFSYQVIYSLLFIPALLTGLKMWLRTREGAWLIHPFALWMTTFSYLIAYLQTH